MPELTETAPQTKPVAELLHFFHHGIVRLEEESFWKRCFLRSPLGSALYRTIGPHCCRNGSEARSLGNLKKKSLSESRVQRWVRFSKYKRNWLLKVTLGNCWRWTSITRTLTASGYCLYSAPWIYHTDHVYMCLSLRPVSYPTYYWGGYTVDTALKAVQSLHNSMI